MICLTIFQHRLFSVSILCWYLSVRFSMFVQDSNSRCKILERVRRSWHQSVVCVLIRRHLIFCICDLLLEFLIPESCDQAFQKSLLQSLSREPDKDSHHTWPGCDHTLLHCGLLGGGSAAQILFCAPVRSKFYCHICVRRVMETSRECSCANQEITLWIVSSGQTCSLSKYVKGYT